MEKFRKSWSYGFVGGSEAEPPNLAKISRKINGQLQYFENFHEFLANFDWKKLVLIIIKGTHLEFWKSLIILKELKKPSDKFLRVWAKSQLRFEIFEKILKFTYKNLRNGRNVSTFPLHLLLLLMSIYYLTVFNNLPSFVALRPGTPDKRIIPKLSKFSPKLSQKLR